MEKLDDFIPIPSKELMNKGLTAARELTMIKVLGIPGELTPNCSKPNGEFSKHVKYNFDIGPFKVSGFGYAVETLRQIFEQVKVELPEVYAEVKTAGVFCVRSRRGNPAKYSNHSWGSAIDLYFGKELVPQGVHKTHRGVYLLFPYFNKFGWYWGAEFSGDSVDSMHFELAEETITKIELSKTELNSLSKGRSNKMFGY